MKVTVIIISIFTLLSSCLIKNKDENAINKLQYIALKNRRNFLARTDSGFILRFATDSGWRYGEYVLKEDGIIMYSDSIYNSTCMVNVIFPIEFYNQDVSGFRNHSNRQIEVVGLSGSRFAYTVKWSSYRFPETMPHLKNVRFAINGSNLSADIDSVELKNLIPEFETLLYAKKKHKTN